MSAAIQVGKSGAIPRMVEVPYETWAKATAAFSPVAVVWHGRWFAFQPDRETQSYFTTARYDPDGTVYRVRADLLEG